MDLSNLSIQAIANELGTRDLMICNLNEQMNKLLSIPGVKEAIAVYEQKEAKMQSPFEKVEPPA